MSFYYVQTGGTRTSGASTAGDWSAANCYGSIQDALDETSDGDSVVLDDEDWIVSSDIVSTSLAFDGTVLIRSRSMNPDRASLKSSSNSVGVFRFLNTGNTQDFIVHGFTLGKTVIHTGATAAPICQAAQQTGHLTFRDCIVEDVVYETTRNGAGGLVHQASAASTKSLTFDNVKIRRISHKSTAATSYIAAINAGHTFRVLGTLIIEDVSAGGINFGGVYCAGPIDIQGKVVGRRINVDAAGSTVALIVQSGNNATALGDVDAEGVRAVGSTTRACVLDISGPATFRSIKTRNCESVATTNTAGLGCTVVVDTSNGTLTGPLLDVAECRSNYGPALYCTQGGSATIDVIRTCRNQCYMGDVYKGGDGDLTAYCYDCDSPAYLVNEDELPTEASRGGLALYTHAHSSAGRVCATTIYNFTTNADGALPPVHVRNNQGTHATSLSIYNSIVWAEGAKSQVIGTSSGSAAAINLTITDTAIRGGASGVEDGGATTLNTTTARLVSQAPALDANRRPTGSEYREAGRPVPKIGHKDADLLPFKSAPTLGAREISAFAREAA